ncbi:MAG: dienelactone hydrolase family protein [Aquificota bacterium]|jgi:carboxymethylenebutenolidase|nr:dienelactone hydrolase family protein [Aquificaceae bacterium]QWK13042.1 MAG: dienelactone hydrolase family protein [Aquificota bacterium]
MKGFLIALLFMVSFSFATDEFVRGLIDKLMEKGPNAWWWDKRWWEEGYIENLPNYKVRTEMVIVKKRDVDIPVYVYRPDDDKAYPGVLFIHGRRGLDELFQLHAKRLASKGFVVVAPDLYTGRLIPQFPIEHDPIVEEDLDAVLLYAVNRKDIKNGKLCAYGLTRGGYYGIRLLVTYKRQEKEIVCFVAYYPHMQNPNAPEPEQVYRYAPEWENLKIPTLILVGENEQYQRIRPALVAVDHLKAKGVPIWIVVYPGVGRGFDFRLDRRTFADDLASKDALIRASLFIRKYLEGR